MLTHTLSLYARNQPETLERILRVVRHRGFRINTLHAEPTQYASLHIILTVSSERPCYLLTNQLAKLVDVERIENKTLPTQPLLSE